MLNLFLADLSGKRHPSKSVFSKTMKLPLTEVEHRMLSNAQLDRYIMVTNTVSWWVVMLVLHEIYYFRPLIK